MDKPFPQCYNKVKRDCLRAPHGKDPTGRTGPAIERKFCYEHRFAGVFGHP